MITIIAPCFNEQETVIRFLKRLECVLAAIDEPSYVIIVDDCSQDSSLELLSSFSFDSKNICFDVIRLKFNIGQQEAIYQGLMYANTLHPSHAIVMDCDGEDDPAAIPDLLKKRDYDIVTVKRGKRSESMLFRFSYLFYKMIFRLITGKTIDFGNYSMISGSIIERISHTSFVHFPAYLLKQKAKSSKVIFNRTKRIDGKSKMGYKGLLLHAFKSMIEFGEDLLLLFLKLFVVLIVLFIISLTDIFYQKFISHTAILGWFSTLSISLVILAVVCIGFFIMGVLLLNLLHQQNTQSYKQIYSVIKKEVK
jgi:polyisoprenyl-phosphate glycosyltransferase